MPKTDNQLVTYIISSKETFSNILFLNDDRISTNDLMTLSKFIRDIYVAFDSNLTIQSFSVKLRFCKNIHVIPSSHIPLINYDILSSSTLDKRINLILSKITYIKYFFYAGFLDEILDIPSFKNVSKNLYKKDQNDLLVNSDSFNRESLTSELNQVLFSSTNKVDDTKNQSFELENIDNDLKLIRIKQLIPSNNVFDFFESDKKVVHGKLDILCNIKSLDDFFKLEEFVENFEYDYFKFFIFMNNVKIESLNDFLSKVLNFELMVFNEEQSDEKILKIFNILSDGEYKVNFKKGFQFINSLEFLK